MAPNVEICLENYNLAVACLQAGQICKSGRAAQCALSQSARYLVKALLLAKGVGGAATVEAELELLQKHAPDDVPTESLKNILNLNTREPISTAQLRSITQEYLRTIFVVRETLARTSLGGSRPGSWAGWAMLVMVLLLVAGLFLGHRLVAPYQSVADTIQVYWLAEGSPWKESHSAKIKATTDNIFKLHTINLPRTVPITQVRLDPSMQTDSNIEIRSLELLTPDGKVINYDFTKDDTNWSSRNITGSKRSARGWNFQAGSIDPYITSPRFPAVDIQRVNVEMRSRLPTSIIRWIIGH